MAIPKSFLLNSNKVFFKKSGAGKITSASKNKIISLPIKNKSILICIDHRYFMMNKYKIEGYPTIKMLKDGQVIEYDAKPTQATLIQFIQTVL